MARVLIVDDEPNMRKLIGVHLRADNHSLIAVSFLHEAIAALESQDFEVILTDQKLPDGDGTELLSVLKQSESPTSVVVLTAFGTVELAVETMRRGAFDFLTKPFSAET